MADSRPAQDVLSKDGIRLGLTAADKWDAIAQCGALLSDIGAVEPGYPRTMLEREGSVSTYVGEGVAIPHGTDAARALVRRTALGVLQFPGGVDWDAGTPVRVCVAIAAKGEEHITVLSALAEVLLDPDRAERLRTTTSVHTVYELLSTVGREVGA
ncbi:PTS sugar transporter subunit IIA [Amycolatopsis cihanbeyliensis]|uniref:Mannitol-specific phosphotransferase enzyme IIA component n=1 Tax=Amycolatopsis cihanbeyliensis TaxID=1128664 RepID=A0A542DBI1_AMYCI|nr:PTS sugar transporter subunit IIA [Amycolatopsis cihanbeyliensis]TQJ00405.1 PTS system IIA component (Fru family) [Amycolatopsis cihanbeyliensis]